MEAKELMIGDWVKTNLDDILQVDSITDIEINLEFDGNENYGGTYLKEVDPIPLTEEILKKNGFKKNGTDYKSEFISIRMIVHIESNGICYLYIEDKDITCTIEICIKYVHELQHALRLCGINKEIEL